MNERDPDQEFRALLGAARGGDDPTEDDRARVRGRLVAQLGAGALTATAAVTSAQAATGAGVSLGAVAVKLGAVVALVCAVGAGVVAARPRARGGAVAASASRPAPRATEPPVVRPPPAPGVASAAPPPPPLTPRAAPPVHRAVEAPTDTLVEETALVERVHSALVEHRAGDALTMLDGFSWRVPGGELREERAALHVRALCGLGHAEEARAEEARFLRAYPNSPHADALRVACAAEPHDSNSAASISSRPPRVEGTQPTSLHGSDLEGDSPR